jgi:hypothetical protein
MRSGISMGNYPEMIWTVHQWRHMAKIEASGVRDIDIREIVVPEVMKVGTLEVSKMQGAI